MTHASSTSAEAQGRATRSIVHTGAIGASKRANWELIGDRHGVHWPDIDEDLSADGMLNGVPARRPTMAKPLKSAQANEALQPTSRARRKAKARRSSRAARG
jgi:hypothetical protein